MVDQLQDGPDASPEKKTLVERMLAPFKRIAAHRRAILEETAVALGYTYEDMQSMSIGIN